MIALSQNIESENDNRQRNVLMQCIRDIERIGDYATNLDEMAQKMHENGYNFSDGAKRELSILTDAVQEILRLTVEALENDSDYITRRIEPLEEVIDDINLMIKNRHIQRLRAGECTIELGFVLSDLLVNLERVSDHCSNIAGCIIEISQYGALDMHKYIADIRHGSAKFEEKYNEFKKEYVI